jgi:hypothetical protein
MALLFIARVLQLLQIDLCASAGWAFFFGIFEPSDT